MQDSTGLNSGALCEKLPLVCHVELSRHYSGHGFVRQKGGMASLPLGGP